ncbi:molecular chaperone Tir [Chryseobacterium formosense]|uniref:Molecular chaperone Tir n=1 Tax=Chryseobacterium formosense TaxID=236814 RepID=A0A085YYT6_9FLAO|nr:TIR domain-containing protein [Chryseobacterium formosense]KFE97349.1 molecular chaperone Tir [Chryseobacterium formosense]SFT91333.1 MTH538 TIR-like domain [Chryseobacterium formosense]
MAHKCFISFKTEDRVYKTYIHDHLDVDMIDKSLHDPINSYDEDYIMRKIRENYLSDSTVTIFLIGDKSAENSWFENQTFIKRELQSSLYHGLGNTKNGILGVVLPSMKEKIYKGSYYCSTCGGNHNCVSINDNTVIKEFSYNYYIPNDKCAWSEIDRYCVLTTWEDFCAAPNYYIDLAFDKRTQPISNKTKVKP